MQDILNLKIKLRESFRPFAPSILEEAVQAASTSRQTAKYPCGTLFEPVLRHQLTSHPIHLALEKKNTPNSMSLLTVE